MKKRILSGFLMLCMLFTLCPLTAFATEKPESTTPAAECAQLAGCAADVHDADCPLSQTPGDTPAASSEMQPSVDSAIAPEDDPAAQPEPDPHPDSAAALGPDDGVYAVTAENFTDVISRIDLYAGTEIMLVLQEEIDATASGRFAGIEGKHVTLTSADGACYSIDMGTSLVGDLTLDHVKAYTNNSTVYANGHTFETTADFGGAIYGSSIGNLFGGGSNRDVDGDTRLILRGGKFGTIYGGGKNGAVSGSVHLTLEGDPDTSSFGTVYGGGNATGANVTKGQIGGDVYIDFISGQLGTLYGGGANHTTLAKDHRDTAAKVAGDIFITVGDAKKFSAPAPGSDLADPNNYEQGACITATNLYGGSILSSVGNVSITIENGAFLCERTNLPDYIRNAQTKFVEGGGESDIVRGSVDIVINGGLMGAVFAGGSTWSSHGIYNEIQNQANEEYATHVTINGGAAEYIYSNGEIVSNDGITGKIQIYGGSLCELNGGLVLRFVQAYSGTKIHGDSRLIVRDGATMSPPSVYGYDTFDHEDVTGITEVIFDGCGGSSAQGDDQLFEFTQIADVENVKLINGAKVSLAYLEFPDKTYPALKNVTDLSIDAGTLLALDAPVSIHGDLVLNGTLAQARERADFYNGPSENTVYPALLEVGGSATGTGTVLTMKTDKWLDDEVNDNEALPSRPIVGEIYIHAAKAGSTAAYTLKNKESDLYLKRIDQPDHTDRYAWQIASGYTVTYDKNEGDTQADPGQSIIEIDDPNTVYTVGILPVPPSRAGYTFQGWNTQADGSGTPFTAQTPVNASLTVYAQWEKLPQTVTFLPGAHGSLDGTAQFAVTYGATMQMHDFAVPAVDSSSGWKFTGWLDAAGNSYTAAQILALAITQDMVFTAQYKKTGGSSGGGGGSSSGTEYILHYESNGGTEYKDERYAKNTVVPLDKTPVREGYEFTGWYADKTLTEQISSIKMTSDKTVYAGWWAANTPGMLNGDDHFAYVIGYEDGTVQPQANISRAEVATIFFRLLNPQVRDANLTSENAFTDVASGTWCNTPVSTMAKLGIVRGREPDCFDPNAPITRAEFAAICARFDTGAADSSSRFTDTTGHWAEAEIARAADLGWIAGYTDGSFRPQQPITRAEAMTIINRVLCRIPEDEDGLLDNMRVWPDNPPNAWYYLAVQEATNSHDFVHSGEAYERWISLTADPDWTRYQD